MIEGGGDTDKVLFLLCYLIIGDSPFLSWLHEETPYGPFLWTNKELGTSPSEIDAISVFL